MTTISITRGDDKSINFAFTDGNSAAIDITGYTLFFTVKEVTDTASDDTAAVISKTVTSHTDAVNGLSSVTITNADSDITPDRYKFDVQLKTDAGSIKTVVKGDFIVSNDVTKRTT